MTPREVQRLWRTPVKTREVVLGSDSAAYAAICDGATQGWARFWGSNGGPFALEELHFIAGARTESGVRIGSTRTQVMQDYGSRAIPRKQSNELQVLGHPRYRYGRDEPRARLALVFAFRGGKVSEIVLGWRDAIRGDSWKYEITALPTC
jgi:hypothetical protein